MDKAELKNKLKSVCLAVLVLGLATGQVWGEESLLPGPLRLYIIADSQVGHSDKGQDMLLFAELCNLNKPDIVLDLGDTIEAQITKFYDKDTHREASLAQQRDWLAAWDKILIRNKAVALGNRDVGLGGEGYGFVLSENKWVKALGYQGRPLYGGTKLQESFKVGDDNLKALVFILCTDAKNYNQKKTLDWIKSEIINFQGDWIIFASHRPDLYPDIRDLLAENKVSVPAIFLHGHYHGPDTLVRDALGYEPEFFDFPSYLVTPLMKNGIGVKFKLYPDGKYEKFRLNVRTKEISEPVVGYQTFLENKQQP
jgi:hypothetical protein